jgi:hypothetical protein
LTRAVVFCVAVLASVLCTFEVEAGTPDVEFKVKIDKEGFHDSNGQLISTPFQVKKGEAVRLTFLFDEKTSEVLRDILRDANEQHGYVHAFALHNGKEIVAETKDLSLKNRESTLDFVAGDKGAQRYKVYCTLMCFGMEHLSNLTVEVH